MALTSLSFCLYLLNVEITVMYQDAGFVVCPDSFVHGRHTFLSTELYPKLYYMIIFGDIFPV